MKAVLVDERINAECERSLLLLGYTPLKLPADSALPSAIASHPDTAVFYHERQLITTADYCDGGAYIFSDIRELCPSVKISFTAERRGNKYPQDCIMNALVIGDRMFIKTDTVSEAIKRYADEGGYKIIHTNQGYPACSVLAFGNGAITADEGLASLMEAEGIKVTRISRGGISLPPYEYGFIGGAGGVLSNKVCFFGDPMTHPDGEAIIRAVKDEGYTPVALCSGELSDMGGIILL